MNNESDTTSNIFEQREYLLDRPSGSWFSGEGQHQLDESENFLLPFDRCLVDHSGRQFACIHPFCQDLPTCFRNGLLQEQLEFHELTLHPEDLHIWCKAAFPDILRFAQLETVSETLDYRFIFNHRYIRKDGTVSQFMHEGALLFSEDGKMPFLNLKVFTEIADIKQDETLILTIFRYSPEGYRKVFSKVYSTAKVSCLSDRELEVVKLCQEGLSSKMIAEKLKLSIHTVKNHKRNCMSKTNTHNITELIHFCIQNRWL
jgi:DNA-binding CsgD family transcriptional regulator